MAQSCKMRGRKAQAVREDYEGFVGKFEPKRTTDDCYTPPAVYDAVLRYCHDTFHLAGSTIARPFWPGGDYQAEAAGYREDTVVIDNPPFSIFTAIRRFYLAKGVKYFLFGPALTLFSADLPDSKICVGATVTYANGAKVNTSFVTNLLPTPQLRTAPALHDALHRLQQKAGPPRMHYPRNIVTSALLGKLSKHGVSLSIPLKASEFVRSIDAQKGLRKQIYGGGYLVADRYAERIPRSDDPREGDFRFDLSARERRIVDNLESAAENPLSLPNQERQ